MSVLFLIACFASVWWIAAVAVLLLSVAGCLLQPRFQGARATNQARPRVALVLPVKQVNPGFEPAQASAFRQDYPNYEVYVAAMEEQSPALVAMRRLSAEAPVRTRFLRAVPRGSVSPKLDTMAPALETTACEVILTKDSNITFAAGSVSGLMRNLVEGVGLVCAVPVAVRAQSLAGHIEAVIINRDARLLLTVSAAGKGFGVGKIMLFRRKDFERCGGVAAISYTIAEDTALCQAFERHGLRTVFAHETIEQEIGARRLRDVYLRQARWAVIRRAEEPLPFVFEPVASPLAASLAAMLAGGFVGLGPWAAFGLTLGGWYALEVAVTAVKGWEIGPWTPLAVLGREGVLMAAWLRAWVSREVIWAGRRQAVRGR